MTMLTEHDRRRHSEGFIIVAVLWMMSALATLAMIYSVYLANSAIAVSVNDDEIQTEALVSAALEFTSYRLIVPAKDTRPTRGALNLRLGMANVAVYFVSEAARVDLNAAPKEMLSGLFAMLGARGADADRYADRIVGWRTKPSPETQANEASLYRAAGLNYSPRGAPFVHASELWLVAGLPPALVERALPYVTVYSGRAEINLLDAAPEVIAALSGMRPDRLNALLDRREAAPQNSLGLTGLAGAEQPGAATAGSDAYRVQVRIAFDNGRQRAAEVVILLDGADEPYHVLSWRDGADIPSQSRAAMGSR
jgi:general secretion pathway protein K